MKEVKEVKEVKGTRVMRRPVTEIAAWVYIGTIAALLVFSASLIR